MTTESVGLDQERLDQLTNELTHGDHRIEASEVRWLLDVVQHLKEQIRLTNIDWAQAVGMVEELRDEFDRFVNGGEQ